MDDKDNNEWEVRGHTEKNNVVQEKGLKKTCYDIPYIQYILNIVI